MLVHRTHSHLMNACVDRVLATIETNGVRLFHRKETQSQRLAVRTRDSGSKFLGLRERA
jgi:hypothetical protein